MNNQTNLNKRMMKYYREDRILHYTVFSVCMSLLVAVWSVVMAWVLAYTRGGMEDWIKAAPQIFLFVVVGAMIIFAVKMAVLFLACTFQREKIGEVISYRKDEKGNGIYTILRDSKDKYGYNTGVVYVRDHNEPCWLPGAFVPYVTFDNRCYINCFHNGEKKLTSLIATKFSERKAEAVKAAMMPTSF